MSDARPSARLGAPTALDRIPPTALVLAAILGVQLSAGIATTVIDRVGPVAATTVRLLFAAIVLGAVARRGVWEAIRARPRLVTGLAALLVAANTCFYEALDRIPLGIASAIAFLGPLGVAIAASRSRRDAGFVLLAALGVVLVVDVDFSGVDPAGLAWAFGNAACFAGYVLVGARVGRALPGPRGVAAAFAVGAAATLPLAVVSAGRAVVEPDVLALGLVVGFLFGLSITFEVNALRRLSARVFGVLLCLEPAVGALVGSLALSQRLTVAQYFGIGAIVVASAGATWQASRGAAGDDEPAREALS